ncbi:phosphatidylinositol 4,5-bisphosphate 3-kinase catalytic subunit alpha isoform-like [Amphibalanus amphitrite]|uniref:phosphatidylinositol 4,5-bisphosphate 3-kinase catalytic subunit alpha isoform-like n=1 Tax=Amphibalanus amphitrite TaxID=1232801 RepID=UPI001C90C020|nr:phosphatidylinositol 4,5-bisphosphate 3-kinase catalytic subunit alpha isoform-like [Amphibalanus amphitrite]XP_043240545.1 phosphatidylinositol 4,5-bisphosphate 3-kinase catalytic subunit alpha isoform-like [Amphibalanus amphitrite]XP_043240546.1 phosphatidylinositol 4,5-bisphosphate 3-kinase catalytic subunit alpha isoform-like [Amphibalanus amphitrite]XP_043240547.1 phosphatidylinositol 4,5-bisphosphate 3-kinase catalytic subunit alpha isoform-like [Amphibalanus amphitrite]XP_043240548.1 
MPPSSGELWGYSFMPDSSTVYCLMPTGILIPLVARRDKPLFKLKDDLWKLAKNAQEYPFGHMLGEPSQYIFQGITQDGAHEDFYDETRRFCDLRLLEPYLQVREPHGNKDEEMFNQSLSAIGVQVRKLDEMRDPEVVDFRVSMLRICKKAIDFRELNPNARLQFMHPADLDSSPQLAPNLHEKIAKSREMTVSVSGMDNPTLDITITKDEYNNLYPEGLIVKVWQRTYNQVYRMTDTKSLHSAQQQRDKYLLKVAGKEMYFTASKPLFQYRYIRSCIAKDMKPYLVMLSREAVSAAIPVSGHLEPMYARRAGASQEAGAPRDSIDLFTVSDPFRMTVCGVQYLNVSHVDRFYVKVGLYLGATALCQLEETQPVSGDQVPRWNKTIEFETLVQDLPLSGRLCMGVVGVSKRKKKEEHFLLAWVNLALFDYRRQLLSGKKKLTLWPVSKGDYPNEKLCPLKPVGPNPVQDQNVAWLEVELPSYLKPVEFPSDQRVYELGALVEERSPPELKITGLISEKIREVAGRDPLSDIAMQDAELLSCYRRYCCSQVPNALPKLLDAVKWESRTDVARFHLLLRDWPCVNVEVALELLSCNHRDQKVRDFAVRCLNELLTDDKLSQYLIQLVHALHHELHLDNELTRFILDRALRNKNIGHFLFWHLRTEYQSASTSQRFDLILEAFCRGLGKEHIKTLNKKVQCLDKIFRISQSLKDRKEDGPKERHRHLCERMKETDYLESLQNIPSPLSPQVLLGEILVDESRIMESARRPLWLMWTNPDQTVQHIDDQLIRAQVEKNAIIFKYGDDLRQDMLTLQVIKIMDHTWDQEGLDLRMMPYSCLATGSMMGMIEVVRNAKTVYRIQREASKLAAIQVDSSQLHKWIRDQNQGALYDAAVDTFTRSCAGYCVATFVLGIGDRHPDNIMVNHRGQIFHIDFGHFLGHFKKKFGISRERVPFVLTDDFLRVIAGGADNPKKSKAFQAFQELCGKAYLALRKHSHLFITLFTMMLSTGITELQCAEDVNYLRKTLQVESDEKDALQYFQNQFNEAYGGAWTTKLDWFFHSVKHM